MDRTALVSESKEKVTMSSGIFRIVLYNFSFLYDSTHLLSRIMQSGLSIWRNACGRNKTLIPATARTRLRMSFSNPMVDDLVKSGRDLTDLQDVGYAR